MPRESRNPTELSPASCAWLEPGAIVLAPMDGVTDHVYRDLITSCSEAGRIALCVSEFLRVTDRPLPRTTIARAYPEGARGGTTPAGVPVMLQLLGGDPEALAETAVRAVDAGAFGIDLNFGCPAKLVNRHDGGAALLKAPARIERIVARVRERVPGDRPVSAKIRLGWESHDEVVALALAAERGGASFLTIHGRTKLEMYGPPADWEAIGRARAAVGIAVVANGDLCTRAAIETCRRVSGCSRVMLGRGPMGRPSLLLSSPERHTGGAAKGQLATLLVAYIDRLSAAGASDDRQIARVKQWLSLARTQNSEVTPLFDRVKRLHVRADVLDALSC